MHNKKRWAAFILMLLWMGLIFFFSAQEAPNSSRQSMGIVKIIKAVAEKVTSSAKDFDMSFWESIERLIRKMAHGFIYLVLGVLAMNYMMCFKRGKKELISALICFTYALSDEFHQLFVPGRSGQLSDVFVDFTGSVLGIILFSVLYRYFLGRRSV